MQVDSALATGQLFRIAFLLASILLVLGATCLGVWKRSPSLTEAMLDVIGAISAVALIAMLVLAMRGSLENWRASLYTTLLVLPGFVLAAALWLLRITRRKGIFSSNEDRPDLSNLKTLFFLNFAILANCVWLIEIELKI